VRESRRVGCRVIQLCARARADQTVIVTRRKALPVVTIFGIPVGRPESIGVPLNFVVVDPHHPRGGSSREGGAELPVSPSSPNAITILVRDVPYAR